MQVQNEQFNFINTVLGVSPLLQESQTFWFVGDGNKPAISTSALLQKGRKEMQANQKGLKTTVKQKRCDKSQVEGDETEEGHSKGQSNHPLSWTNHIKRRSWGVPTTSVECGTVQVHHEPDNWFAT